MGLVKGMFFVGPGVRDIGLAVGVATAIVWAVLASLATGWSERLELFAGMAQHPQVSKQATGRADNRRGLGK
jgi:hypothetical protein